MNSDNKANNINISELLKYFTSGIKLFSSMCGECELHHNDLKGGHITIGRDDNGLVTFNKFGRYYENGECLLFPSREVRDWSYFKAFYLKDCPNDRGDDIRELFERKGGKDINNYCINTIGGTHFLYIDSITQEIKQGNKQSKEFLYLCENGIELKLKEQPKFKVGDIIITGEIVQIVVSKDVLMPKSYEIKENGWICRHTRLATPEEIAKWNKETLEPNHLHYSKSKRKIIHWFLTFDKCLMRDKGCEWFATIFSHYTVNYSGDTMPYVNISHDAYSDCLPYNEKTAKLIGTTDDYKE